MSHKSCTRPDGNKGCIDCVAYGEREAEERIIKLLEQQPPENWFFVGFRQHIIALIKGENK